MKHTVEYARRAAEALHAVYGGHEFSLPPKHEVTHDLDACGGRASWERIAQDILFALPEPAATPLDVRRGKTAATEAPAATGGTLVGTADTPKEAEALMVAVDRVAALAATSPSPAPLLDVMARALHNAVAEAFPVDDVSPAPWVVERGSIAWMIREGQRGAQIGNFILEADARYVADVRNRADAEDRRWLSLVEWLEDPENAYAEPSDVLHFLRRWRTDDR